MKVLITAKGKTLDSPMDPRFGRAASFLLVNTESGSVEAHDNSQNLNAPQGAGIQAAQNAAELGPEVLISGNIGPNAFRAIKAAGIKIYLSGPSTVGEAIEAFKAGKLPEATAATVDGH